MNGLMSERSDRHLSVGSLATRLDASDIGAVDGMVIKHVKDGSTHMNLADGVGTFCSIVHGIGLEGWDHDLVSNAAVVILETTKIVPANEHLSLVLQILQVSSNRSGWEHVLLGHQASRGCATGLVDARSDCTLS